MSKKILPGIRKKRRTQFLKEEFAFWKDFDLDRPENFPKGHRDRIGQDMMREDILLDMKAAGMFSDKTDSQRIKIYPLMKIVKAEAMYILKEIGD